MRLKNAFDSQSSTNKTAKQGSKDSCGFASWDSSIWNVYGWI
jgi:hypothetical protein